MTDDDKILEAELARLAGGAYLGGAGARWAARRLPNNAFEAAVDVQASAADALAAFADALAKLGRLIGEGPAEQNLGVRGVVRAGFLNLNPAVIDIRVTALEDGRSRVTVTGTAKEGRIKQQAGEKAVARVIAAVEAQGGLRGA